MRLQPEHPSNSEPAIPANYTLRRILEHLSTTIERDRLVQETTHTLRAALQVDRVVLYYFYNQWKGQVTFESLSAEEFSVFGSTGPDDCFNAEYAALYMAGRIRAIADVEAEAIQACHREFLQSLKVRANLVAPILTDRGLWGLLAAHDCQAVHPWSEADLDRIRTAALTIATSPAVSKN